MNTHVKNPFNGDEDILEEGDEKIPSFLDLESDETSEDILFSLSTDNIKTNLSNPPSSSFSLRARRAIEDYWTRRKLLDSDLDLFPDD